MDSYIALNAWFDQLPWSGLGVLLCILLDIDRIAVVVTLQPVR